jgi:AmmeMemoRadiSam system protein B
MRPGRSIRSPAVAGAFYPADPKRLRMSLEGMLASARVPETGAGVRALIVPHAGYAFSGPVAATAYRLLQTRDRPDSLVVVGPSHFVGFPGMATAGVEGFATPLGVVPVDAQRTATAEDHAAVAPNRSAHAREHSIEVQLPFLQVLFDQIPILALLTGVVEPATVADTLQALMEADGVVVIVSSDLSHYLDYDTGRAQDARTARAIVGLQPEDLARDDACGLTGVQAALLVARRVGWKCSLLDLRSSGDTAGGRDTVVGYGSFVIGPAR